MTYAGWLQNFLNKRASLKKEALDKLPQEDLDGTIPGLNPPGGPAEAQQAPPDMSMDPSLMPPPEPEVSGNVFEVDVNGIKVKMRLMPELVLKDIEMPVDSAPQVAVDPMADKSLNPGADPEALSKWMIDQNNEKSLPRSEKGTEEPLSQEEEGIPVHDTGNEADLVQNSIPVHKKRKSTAAIEQTPGADKSRPYYPCGSCANYDAANNSCSQGLDVEKVQAAKSCSWLNSNFKPFGDDGSLEATDGSKDEETYKNDISQSNNGSNTNFGGGQAGGGAIH